MDPANLLPYLPHGAVGLAIAGGVFWLQRHERLDDRRFKYMADQVEKLGDKIDASILNGNSGREKILELLLEMKNGNH